MEQSSQHFYSSPTKITPVTQLKRGADDGFLLDDTLRPACKFLFYSGMLPNLNLRRTDNRAMYAVRCLLTATTISLLSLYIVFLSVQLMVQFQTGTRVLDVVMLTYMFVITSSALFFHCHLLIHEKNLIEFLKDWKKIEIDSLTQSNRAKKRVAAGIYGVYLIYLVTFPSLIYSHNQIRPNEVIFYSNLDWVRDSFHINLVSISSALGMYVSWVLFALGEIIPTTFFYHAGCIIQDLQQQLLDTSITSSTSSNNIMMSNLYVQFKKQEQPYRRIWAKYETVLGCVKQGNRMFQGPILWLHTSLFVIECLSLYFISKSYELQLRKPLILSFVGAWSVLTIQIIAVFRLMSHPYSSREKLRNTVADLLSSKWDSLPEEDRQLLEAFQERLGSEKMGVMPFDLYTVRPSNLLNILSLIVTYSVVLFQIQPRTGNL